MANAAATLPPHLDRIRFASCPCADVALHSPACCAGRAGSAAPAAAERCASTFTVPACSAAADVLDAAPAAAAPAPAAAPSAVAFATRRARLTALFEVACCAAPSASPAATSAGPSSSSYARMHVHQQINTAHNGVECALQLWMGVHHRAFRPLTRASAPHSATGALQTL